MVDPATSKPRIVLGSGSPRRRELAERIGWEPVVVVSDIPEDVEAAESPTEYTQRLALQKAADVAEKISGDASKPNMILSADTIVILDGDILEKPEDGAHAFEMLRAMSGRWHTVQTSFCWFDRTSSESHVESIDTDVRLRELSDAFIRSYVETGEPLDKAGSYGIQDFGSLLVRELEGSYFNVVGLPVCEAVEALEKIGNYQVHPLLMGESTERRIET